MQNLLLVVGPEGSNVYEDCREFLNKYHLNDTIIIDVRKLFERIHYKENIKQDFQPWFKAFTQDEITKIISIYLNKRVTTQEESIKNTIITGEGLTLTQCTQIGQNIACNKKNILFIDASPQVLYRNLSLHSISEINVQDFLLKLKKHYCQEYSSIIAFTKNQNTYFYKNAADTKFDHILSKNLGCKPIKNITKSLEPYIWPIIPKYLVTQHDLYGERPLHIILGKAKFHSGFDITAKTLTPIHAASDGIVVYSGLDERILSGESKWNERYGNVVELVDVYGRRQIYAHLRNVLVREGGMIKKGQILGLSGCSGGARTPHLHFEIRKFNVMHSGEENTINPLEILPKIDFESLNEKFDEEPYATTWNKLVETPFGLTDKNIPYANSKEFIR